MFLFLSRLDYKVSVVLPTKIKHFISSHGKHSKNDKNDSAMLSLYGLERHPEVTAIPSDEILGLKSLTRHYQCLQERRTALLNQEEANFHRGYNSELSKTHLEAGLKQLNEQLEEVNKAIKKHINDSADLLANYKLVEPIHGIGYLSFAVFYAESNGFVKIKNVRQLVSYAGYDVIENQSGTRSGKTRISKKGNYRIRRAMHMPALVAIKNKDSIFYNLYERVYEKTKIKMKAYVAVQRKLISIMYSILKKQEVFSNEYVPQKNTPPKKEIQTDLISI